MIEFVGRQAELTKLNNLLDKKIARLIILKGRRRVDKSRLLVEFGKRVGRVVHLLTGLALDRALPQSISGKNLLDS